MFEERMHLAYSWRGYGNVLAMNLQKPWWLSRSSERFFKCYTG